MRYLTGSLFVLVVAGLIASAVRSHSIADDGVKPIPTETPQDELRQAMMKKLALSKDILHGLVTKDFDKCSEAAEKLQLVSLKAPRQIEGDESDNEIYQHFKLEFLRLANQISTQARKENLEGTAFAYQNLTANCMACHSYLAEKKATTITR